MKTTQLANKTYDQNFYSNLESVSNGKDFAIIDQDQARIYTKQNSMFVNYRRAVQASELEALQIPVVATQGTKAKRIAKVVAPAPVTEVKPFEYMQSKTGMFHIVGYEFDKYTVGACQSYNLDLANKLQGEKLSELPEGARLCKKCATRLKGEK